MTMSGSTEWDPNEKASQFAQAMGEKHPPDDAPKRPYIIIKNMLLRSLTYILVMMCLLAASSISILAVWDLVTAQTAARTFGTAFIVAVTVALFVAFTESFKWRP